MKRANPPLQFIFVGLESNQQGQAASQEQASSSWPDIFQEVDLALSPALSSASTGRAATRATPAKKAKRERMRYLLEWFLFGEGYARKKGRARGTANCKIERRPLPSPPDAGERGTPGGGVDQSS